MRATIKAVTPQEFEQWLASKRQQIESADDAAAQQRKRVEAGQNP